MTDTSIEHAIDVLSGATRVVAFSGAGISAESGVPTFRDAGGLWEEHRIEDVATPTALRRNPRKVWEFYEKRRENMQSVEPNPGHLAIAAMESVFEQFAVVTQNIDGLHQRAGSTTVHEVHGSLWKASCLQECGRLVDPFPFPAPEIPPPCECGGLLRPAVVLFEEMLPEGPMTEAVRAAMESEVVLAVGTSSGVWPAAGIPLVAQEAGATIIEVNPEETELSDRFDLVLRGPSGSVLPRLLERVRERRG